MKAFSRRSTWVKLLCMVGWTWIFMGCTSEEIEEAVHVDFSASREVKDSSSLEISEILEDLDYLEDLEDDLYGDAEEGEAFNGDEDLGELGEEIPRDRDGDGYIDEEDNCPEVPNPDQGDWNEDGVGDACTYQDGSSDHPWIISIKGERTRYEDHRDTRESPWDQWDVYPPATQDESGPEYTYLFRIQERHRIRAWILGDATGEVDIDVHLLSEIEPLTLIGRGHLEVEAVLEPGIYYLVMDTFVSGGVEHAGPYDLHVEIQKLHDGTEMDPWPIGGQTGPLGIHTTWIERGDTSQAISDQIDVYPPATQDESGREVIYRFEVEQKLRFSGEIRAPEPDGVDVDLHLLKQLDPLILISRGDQWVYGILEPGTYYLVVDSFSMGSPLEGAYTLDIVLRPVEWKDEELMNTYIVEAVNELWENYGLLGYDSAVLTHAIAYGSEGMIEPTAPPRTMCVAAVMEVILTAMTRYALDTGDSSVWAFLEKRDFESLSGDSLKAHLWVNPDLGSRGSADALRHFGMGMTLPFESLRPGSLINLNRTSGTGHAVIFMGFIDREGQVYDTWPEGVEIVGFKYFSSQGGYDTGGLDFRYAIFSEYGSLSMPYLRDTGIIYSEDQKYLNTGVMYRPAYWRKTTWSDGEGSRSIDIRSEFDAQYFDGQTIDDP